jgi:DNA-directed RNA polymerase subunit RPC12/RpoP
MKIACPRCSHSVLDMAPACPNCGLKVYIEHPGDIPGVRHLPRHYPAAGLLAKATSLLALLTFVR